MRRILTGADCDAAGTRTSDGATGRVTEGRTKETNEQSAWHVDDENIDFSFFSSQPTTPGSSSSALGFFSVS